MLRCYELITIKVKNEFVLARPVAWDRDIYDGDGNDINGEPVNPTEYHATCPHCGNLIHFSNEDIYIGISGPMNVKCEVCGAADIKAGSEIVSAIEPKEVCFLDPIAEGLFDLDVNTELLEKLDSAEFD